MGLKLLKIFLLASSWVYVGLSDIPDLVIPGLPMVGGDSPQMVPCTQSLVPCHPYLSYPFSPPSSSCCIPLKEMLAGHSRCLCSIFGNTSFLQKFNVTQSQALQIPTACGASTDISICTSDTSPGEMTTPSSTSTSLSNGYIPYWSSPPVPYGSAHKTRQYFIQIALFAYLLFLSVL